MKIKDTKQLKSNAVRTGTSAFCTVAQFCILKYQLLNIDGLGSNSSALEGCRRESYGLARARVITNDGNDV